MSQKQSVTKGSSRPRGLTSWAVTLSQFYVGHHCSHSDQSPLCTVLPNQPFVAMGGAASTAGAVAAGVGKMKEGELQRSSRVEG